MSTLTANHRADDTSSSQGLSSPPSASPTQLNAPASDSLPFGTASRTVKDEDNETSKTGVAKGRRGTAASAGESAATVVTRKPRKKREPEPNASATDTHEAATTTTFGVDGNMKKPRAARGTSAAYQKKMQKKAAEEAELEAKLRGIDKEWAAREFAADKPLPNRPTFNFGGSPPSTTTTTAATHQSGNREAIQNPITIYTHTLPPTTQTAQRPASGQNYDPIRSSTIAPQPTSPSQPSLNTPTKPLKTSSASASPSISSLIDPPNTTRPSSYNLFSEQPKRNDHDRESLPPDPKRPRITPPAPASASFQTRSPTPTTTTTTIAKPTNAVNPNSIPRPSDAMDIDTDTSIVPTAHDIPKKPSPKTNGNGSSTPHSPKPIRPPKDKAQDPSAPLPTSGSGLLSGSIFGNGADSTTSGAVPTAPTVVLDIPLTGESNQYINFTELAEKRYGFNALHPRLAAQRRRLADVAAMGAAIEKNAAKPGSAGGGVSTDDKSVDLSADEAADDSNVEMGGMGSHLGNGLGPKSGEETNGAGGGEKKPARKKRMMKEDMYDKDDDFVDDTELAWEEQAAVSKDGFFVYSGLLVPEGEDAKVERTDGPPPTKRGGRGGGRGSRGGRGGSGRGGASAASAAGKDGKDGKLRKARTTKADKEKMEKEKSARETLAPLASKPVGYVGGSGGV